MAGDAQLEGKVVAITGASSGIGEATALACSRAGAAVAVAARRGDRLEALVGRIEEGGGRAVPFTVDVSDEAQAAGFVEQAAEQLGGLDALVNNAGVMLLGPIEGGNADDWRRMIEVNCLGPLYCTRAALPILRDQGGGDIVNISSVAGRRAQLGVGAYNMTKFGLNGFSEALRQEALHSNIRVTVVEPGFVATELQAHNADNPVVMQATEKMREQIGEVLEPEDIAAAILYAITQPSRVSVNELLVRPTKQRH